MTKLLTFSNPSKNHEKVYSFIKNLVIFSNNQRVKSERFNQLIQTVVSNSNNDNNNKEEESNKNEKSFLNTIKEMKDTQRKSYMLPSDIQQDLVECNCDKFMQIKTGTVNISTGLSTFAIKT